MILALFAFYRNFIVPSIIINAIGWFFIIQSGSPYSAGIFLTKVTVNVVLGTFTHFFRADTYIFYHNLGISLPWLYGFSFFMDGIVYVLGSILVIYFFV
jgi:hypothetical protein